MQFARQARRGEQAGNARCGMRVIRNAAMGAVFLVGAAGVFAVAQRGQQPVQPIQPTQQMPENPSRFPIDGRMPADSDALAPSITERQAKMRNDDRQKQMVSDTDKLVQLATQLKEEVSKDGNKASPDDVSRKAEEIEKLAKSVKERMKG